MVSRTGVREFLPFAVLLAGGLLFCLWRLGGTALFDLDEGGYAEIAREMLILDDWIIPRLNFVRLLDKPPLLYWLTAVSFKLFGISEFSARLPVALSTVGIMALCTLVGRRCFGSLTGLLAAVIFGTCAGVVVFETGRQLQPDMVFTLFLTAAMSALLLGLREAPRRESYFLLAHGAMALAVMTKGLIGLVFPAAALLGFALLTREPGILRQILAWRGVMVFLLIVLPWHLAAEWRSPGFLRFYLLDVHFLRFFNEGAIASSMTSLSLGGLWAGTALIFHPWTFFLPLVLWDGLARFRRASRHHLETGEGRVLLWLWLWVAVILGFFSICSFRLFYYGLPALPALAILSGRIWAGVIRGDSFQGHGLEDAEVRQGEGALNGRNGCEARLTLSGRDMGDGRARVGVHPHPAHLEEGPHGGDRPPLSHGSWLTAGVIPLFIAAAAILVVALAPGLWRDTVARELYGMVDTNLMGYDDGVVTASKVVSLPSWEELSTLAIWCGSTLTAVTVIALGAAVMRKHSWAFVFVALSMVILRYFSQVGTEIFEPYVSTRSLGEAVAATFQPGDRIVMDGLYEDVASVTFYSGQKISLVHGVKKDLAFGARYPDAAGIFLEEDEFLRLWNSGTRVYLLTDYPSNDRPGRDAFYSGLRRHYVAHSGSMKLFTNHPLSEPASDGRGSDNAVELSP